MHNTARFSFAGSVALLSLAACSGNSGDDRTMGVGGGGTSNLTSIGGSSSGGAGGSVASTHAVAGGASSRGGTSATGGAGTTGGSVGSGGASTGGSSAIGSSQSVSGGTAALGGRTATTGGTNATGGSTTSSTKATGGTLAAGGTKASGGTPSTGGTTSSSSGPASVRWIGRVDARNAAAVKFAWSGTGFVASVQGTKISVKLQSESSAAFFQPVIDGALGTRFKVDTGAAQTVVLGTNLAAGAHKVELYRETEGGHGDTVFQGFVDGTLLAAPAAPGRLIEIVGDSISAGYGNLGVNPCGFTIDTESAYQAYGWQLGRLLNADVSVIAISGWGMYRAYGGSTSNILSSVYANTLGTQASPAWDFVQKPDAVLINLGTNDSSSGDPLKPYEDAYVSFLRTVRSHYPSAWIFLTIGPMTGEPMLTTMRSHIGSVITTLADSKVIQVNIDTQATPTVGCDWHPTVAEDTIVANALKTQLAAKLGW